MNTAAVLVGLFYGVISAVVCYVVSMVTSGIFARPFYRLYARVLIGICSVMLIAPGLRWMASTNPQLAALSLTMAQYAVMGVLGYGVLRFNRDYMKKLFLERKTAAYFTFGTLAYAAVVTLAFLHVAITGEPSWHEHGQGYIGAAHYGPLLVILAAMVFHTDHHLKQSVGDRRWFSRFTFIGYAISFLGLALSIVPYLANAFSQLGLMTSDSVFLQNFFSGQALLIAIILYAWLVYRYESIPPLFLLLLAIVGEYHVLATQWAIQSYGPASWGLASLPLFAGIAALDHYFANWDQRKRKSSARAEPQQPAALSLRFAMPFRFIEVGLGVTLLCITLWTRLSDLPGSSVSWLVATFGVYACFFLGMAILRKEASLVYVSGLLAGLAALLGLESLGGPMSVALLGGLALGWGTLAFVGENRGLKLPWRTPLADCCLLSAILVTVIVLSRHFLGEHPYYFQAVGFLDALALGFAALAYGLAAHQYRSWLPVFGVLVALATTIPPWSAAIALFATAAAALFQRWVKKENAVALEGRVQMFGISKLPLADVLPELYVQPLSMGAIPLALTGLLISASHVFQGNFSATILSGAAASALGLGLLTRTYRVTWLYVLSLAATYFSVHAIAHGLFFVTWPAARAISAHLAVAASLSLLGWIAAMAYAAWCGALLKRVAEATEPAIRAKRSYYAGLLFDVTSAVAGVTLAAVSVMWLSKSGTPALLIWTASLTSILFALAASVYRSQVGVYLSLTAITLAALNALTIWNFSPTEMAAVVAAMGLSAAAVCCLAWGRRFAATSSGTNELAAWKRPLPLLPAAGLGLWLRPLAVYSIVSSLIAIVVAVLQIDAEGTVIRGLVGTAPLTFAMASGSFLLCTRAFRTPSIYLAGIALGYATFHAIATLALDREVFEGQAQLVHLVLAGALSLMSCCVAAICASAINMRSRGTDEARRASLREDREFYAGILQHFSFAASCVALLALARWVIFDDLAMSSAALMNICVGVLLAVTFSLSGAIYHSRIQTYCALAAACFALHGVATMLVPAAYRDAYQTLFVSISALLFGVISWLITRLEHRRSEQVASLSRWYDCWEKPPLPLVSMDASLWARPLAHVSVCLAFLGLFLVGRDWFADEGLPAEVWLAVSPIYLAAAALFIATTTHRFGWLSLFLDANKSDQQQRCEAADLVERGALYVISLITGGLAIHLTVQLLALETLPHRLALSWQVFLGALLTVVGWSLATLYTIRCRRRLNTSPDSQGLRKDLELYGGLLHHVAAFAAAIVLASACAFGIPPHYLSAPLLLSIGLLILFFGLASLTYQSLLPSYISLLAVGLAALHLSSIGMQAWPAVGSLDAPAIAFLGLILVSLASIVTARMESDWADHRDRFMLPSPWSRSLSSNVASPLAIWKRPLREASIFYAVIGLIMMVTRSFYDGSWDQVTLQALSTYFCVAATFALAARLYDTSLLTYGAAIVVMISTIPQLVLLGLPIAHLGIVLSLVAMLFWAAGFVVEKYCMFRDKAADDPLASSLTRVYEQPMIRCSVMAATIAIAHSLLIWKTYGWSVSDTPLAVACALGAVTLMLNARSLNLLHRVTRARALVYFACASITGCSLVATSMAGSIHGLGPSAAITALILGIVGLFLIENARAVTEAKPSVADTRLTFGEPISHFASGLAMLAVVLAMFAAIDALGLSPEMPEVAGFDLSQLVPPAATLLISATVCLLTVRAQRDGRWLYGAVILGSGGLCLLVESQAGWSLGVMTVGTLILMNLLVASARVIRANRGRFESVLGLSDANCERPFFQWPLLFTTALLISQGFYLATILAGSETVLFQWPWLWVSLLSGGVFFHILYLQPHSACVHLLAGASVVGVLGICVAGGMRLTPDVALCALGLTWGVVAGLLNRAIGTRTTALLGLPLASNQRGIGERLLLSWSVGLILLSIAITIPMQMVLFPGFPNVTVTLFLALMAGVIGGYRWRSVHAETVSALLFPVCLASCALYYGHPGVLIEFGSLIAACLALTYFAVGRITQRGEAGNRDPFFTGVGSSLINLSYLFSGGVVIAAVVCMVQSSPATPIALSMALISSCWLWMAWVSDHEIPAYASVVGFFVTPLYSGHTLLGIPFTGEPLAAFFVIGFSFLLYGVNILASRAADSRAKVLIRPSYYIALALPIVLLVAIPFDQRPAAAFALLAAGSFYLLIARQSQIRWAMYVAAGLVNVAIYLWVPAVRELTGLYQLYVIPAAITVLIFAQLHRHELNAQVLTSIRLAASAAILAVSTFEVFFSRDPSLLQFVVVLLLSLAGITSGISLRIKPFVYVGIAFLVINVAGQLGLQFHREGGVVRAIILIGVGLVILSAMIFFNIHRERIVRQYQGFLVDKHWE